MLEELRLNPRSPGARSWGRCPGEGAAADGDRVNRRLSTGFAGVKGGRLHRPFAHPEARFEEVVE